MKRYQITNMAGGWFIGDFLPSVFQNKAFEIGIKYYQAGDRGPHHVHRQATEVTALVQGRVRMMDQELSQGDIIVLEPGEASGFEALEDSALVVVKYPSVPSDKHLIGD